MTQNIATPKAGSVEEGGIALWYHQHLEDTADAHEAARRREDRAALAREIERDYGPCNTVRNAAWKLADLLCSLPAERIGQAVGLEHEASIAEAQELALALTAYAELRAVRPAEIKIRRRGQND